MNAAPTRRALALSEPAPALSMIAAAQPELDLTEVTLVEMHALLYDVIRFAWASRTPVYVLNAIPVVRSALLHVETYAQGG